MCFSEVYTPILVQTKTSTLCFFTQVFFNDILMYQKDAGHTGSTQCMDKKPTQKQSKHNFIHTPFLGIIYIILKGFYNAVLKKINTFKLWAVHWLFN